VTLGLLVIAPSRGRPGNIAALHDAWQATTTGAAGLLVAADDDDPTLGEYKQVCSGRGIELVVGPRLRMVGTLNKVAVERAPKHFALGFFGDDHRPRSHGWDKRYLDELRDLGTGIVYGNDLVAKDRLPTQVAMTSDIVQTLGWMALPALAHLWVDNVWWDLGHALNRIRYLPDVIVEHCHPLAGTAAEDDGYREVNHPDAFERDRQAYARWYQTQMPDDVEKLAKLIEAAA
jgi:hypothetical protein